MDILDILFIACLLLLYFLPKKSEKSKFYYLIPLIIFLVGIGIRIHSKIESHKSSEKIIDLRTQVSTLENDLKDKEQKISELEKKTKILRSIEGNIECLISANWDKGDHPGDLVPVSWNKSQFYLRIFEKNSTANSTICFYLNSIETKKLSENDLKVELVVKSALDSGPFGQQIDVLKKYKHLLIYIPFINKNDTVDGKMTIRNCKATFIINGEHKSRTDHSDNFILPLPDTGKVAAFRLNKIDLFYDIFINKNI